MQASTFSMLIPKCRKYSTSQQHYVHKLKNVKTLNPKPNCNITYPENKRKINSNKNSREVNFIDD